jgi:hypothetical protein
MMRGERCIRRSAGDQEQGKGCRPSAIGYRPDKTCPWTCAASDWRCLLCFWRKADSRWPTARELLNSSNYAADITCTGCSFLAAPCAGRGPPAGFARLGASPTGSPGALAGPATHRGDSWMKQCIALAALVCLAVSGCAQSRMMGCGDGCYGATSRRGQRPLLTRSAARPSGRVFGKDGGCNDGVCRASACMDCNEGSCSPCNCSGCACGGPCQRMAERVAGGFCGCAGGGVCPTGTYPESPAFQPGPPVGQVAYPYYTVRGPRDFLLDKPASIGPY